MKKCPFCAEEIQDEAIKCRFCGEWLENNKIESDNIERNYNKSIEKVRDEWSTNKFINKVALVLFPIVSFFIGLLSIFDKGEKHIIVSLIYFVLAFVGWRNIRKRRVENKTWFLHKRWPIWLAWTVCLLFLAGIILGIILLIKNSH